MNLPTPKVETIEGIKVVRDDLILGGTKVRALPVLLKGANEFVYASPASGYAQVAIAVACRMLKKRARIFTADRQRISEPSQLSVNNGARIEFVKPGYLSVCEAKAKAYTERTPGSKLLPFGLDDPAFITALADVASSMPIHPTEVWSVAGSGVLQRALQLAWPRARFFAVQIGKEPDVGRAERLYKAPERFEQAAKILPSFPSVDYYDAKAWAFVKKHATKGALFWNVAG